MPPTHNAFTKTFEYFRAFWGRVVHRCVAHPLLSAILVLAPLTLVVALYLGVVRPPSNFPVETVFRIEEGSTLREVASALKEANLIRFEYAFIVAALFLKGESGVVAGDYYFPHKKNLYSIANMTLNADYGLVPVKVVIPEGASVTDIADILHKKFNRFDTESFLRLAIEKEGYLFPDTYYFLPTVTATATIAMFEETFYDKIKPLAPQIVLFGAPLHDIVTMASIIEREARDSQARRLISSVLWNRLKIGMPLQVDVTFDYINGKDTFDLSIADLDIDSPYNTYRYPGLPPGPIANPGLDAIIAAIEPVRSNYLYFLAGHDGEVYFGETFEEHKENRAKYLY